MLGACGASDCAERLERSREDGPPRGLIDYTLYLRFNPGAHALRYMWYMYCIRLRTDCFAVHCKSLQLQRDPIGTEEA